MSRPVVSVRALFRPGPTGPAPCFAVVECGQLETVMSADVGQPLLPSEQKLDIAYTSTVQHWIHAEETRWALLYNYSTASSILLLAWAAVFTTKFPYRAFVLMVFAGCGLVVSVVWIFLVNRASGFVHSYSQLGERLEVSLAGRSGWGTTDDYPFTCAQAHRRMLSPLVSALNSRRSVVLVPSLFAFLYAALAFVAYRS